MAYNGIFGVRPPFPGAAGRKRVWTKLARNDARMISRSGDADENPAINLERWSQNAADGDLGGVHRAKFFNDVRELVTVAKMVGIIDDVTDGSEDGSYRFDAIRAGVLTAGFRVGDSIYFNANSDPGSGKIDADDLLISGRSLLWTPSSVDLTNGGADDQTALSVLSGVSSVSTIEIHIAGASTDAANTAVSIEIGDSGGFHVSGYTGLAGISTGSSPEALSASFKTTSDASQDAASLLTANITLRHLGSNVWSFESNGAIASLNASLFGHGIVTLDTELTQLQITTEAGTAVFDGGTAYVRYR